MLEYTNSKLLHLMDTLVPFHNLVNSCSVEFITGDLFTSLLPLAIQNELLAMSDDQLAKLPSCLATDSDLEGEVGNVIRRLRGASLENLGLVRLLSEEDLSTTSLLDHFDKIMPPKKTHEVCRMSKVVMELKNKLEASSILDLGSGKAYLSHSLSALYKVPVLAVDSSSTNSQGAEQRESNLASRWEGLKGRAEERKLGGQASSRKQRLREARKNNNNNGKASYDQRNETGSQIEKLEETKSLEASNTQRSNDETSGEKDQLVCLTQFVADGSDCGVLVREHLGSEAGERFGMVGLHTCGDLASTSLRLFLSSPNCSFICSVGCCYHHNTEKFYQHPDITTLTPSPDTEPGFPLSTVLKDQAYWLGRPTRMLAAQPLNRLADNPSLPTPALLWRAVLQVLIQKHCPHLTFRQRQVGKIAGKSSNFVQYCRRAFSKFKIVLELSDEEIEELFSTYEQDYNRKLSAFHQFRALFAPLVESIILADRLAVLQEQKSVVKEAYIFKLFNQSVSPRAYALIATKFV